MQFTTRKIFRHKLLSPKGSKFDSTHLRDIKHVVSDSAYLLLEDKVLCWEDIDMDLCSDLDASFFDKHLNQYLIDSEKI